MVRELDDPRLELVRLLNEACEVEHSLMLQYLYAAFSVRPRYVALVGAASPSSSTLLGIAIQEMHHLRDVNRVLVELGAAPNFGRQDFPYQARNYPFPMTLERLSRESVAKYVYAEAPRGALAPGPDATPDERALAEQVVGCLNCAEQPNHVGSLYGDVLALLDEIELAEGSARVASWRETLLAIKEEGEQDHFPFFRDVFLGHHPALAGTPSVWADPSAETYPSFDVPRNPSALGSRTSGLEGRSLALAKLGNWVYWASLLLLDLSYRARDARGEATRQHAIGLMSSVLYPLAQRLAAEGRALPFDRPPLGHSPGADAAANLELARVLLATASRVAVDLGEELGPHAKEMQAALRVLPRGERAGEGGTRRRVSPAADRPAASRPPVLVAGAGPAG
ncbi:MAG: ferritin-like domain-containing protein, partial [Myxococcota bacterium]